MKPKWISGLYSWFPALISIIVGKWKWYWTPPPPPPAFKRQPGPPFSERLMRMWPLSWFRRKWSAWKARKASPTPGRSRAGKSGSGGRKKPPASKRKLRLNTAGKKPEPQPAGPNKMFFWTVVLITSFGFFDLVLGIVASFNDWSMDVVLVAACLQVLYFVPCSFRVIREGFLAGRIYLGTPIDNVESGIVYAPLGFYWLRLFDATQFQWELPAEPHLIWRGGGKNEAGNPITPESIPKELSDQDYRPPIRITFKKGKGEGALYEQTTAEVTPVVTGRITNPCLFIVTIGNEDDLHQQLEDACVAFCSEQLNNMSLQEALFKIKGVSKELRKRLNRLVKGWGVTIDSAHIKVISLSHELNAAIQAASMKAASARGVVREAWGTKRKKILEGQGDANAAETMLVARGNGLKSFAEATKTTGYAALAVDAARSVGEKGNLILAGGEGGMKDLMAVAAGASRAIKTHSTKDASAEDHDSGRAGKKRGS